MSGSATVLSPRTRRWIRITAPVLVLLGSVAAPAQASDFYPPYRYDDGAPRYDYDSYRDRQSSVRPGGVIERRYKYVEREYVERRYSWPVHRPGYGCCDAPYPDYRTSSTPFPWGYGGVRGQQPSYGDGASAYYGPRPPAPVGYDAGRYSDEGRRWDPE
jgi:hypothetical protein